ncbi:hypothetical protein MSAS_02230 [Mycobacterium saskatchewanense]|uniref:Uncharacterized protein n=1 Tax=Mycobacterium saskatchewanense TaxID=220927 RepID=A0AAJ3NNF8_9MYCO|nr:hypothetical protein [Mycobacterium saskatchewanense]ORW69602.1 hypothetical protein AWC23_01580 [Mycobacterium saskatchewanense]BBX61049.1 hypothetical protein MSAS_02230 [Mycobacterium saskatchewanense]
MKLARPDVFHPRIVLAGTADADDAGLVGALRRHGLHARWLPWDDPRTTEADLVILRAARDCAGFLAWTTRVRNLLNPPAVVAWNLDERYLRDLESAGVPTGRGEPGSRTALIFFGGAPSHAFDGTGPVQPDFELWDLGSAATAAAAERAGVDAAELLYARADVSGGRLVSLDLVAPSLGWRRLDAAARDRAQRGFALAVESALERLGLGPLPHRGP